MPLPDSNIAWPPKALAPMRSGFDIWSAWYSGDTAALTDVYNTATTRPSNRPSQFRGGVVGAVARTFWGAPRLDLSKPAPAKLHVPIAADICQASADLLFAEPPTITVDHAATQTRLTELLGDGMLTTLAEAAEVGAGLGGVYLRVTWDTTVADGPFVSKVDADAAWPEFRWGNLVAVTFWHVVAATDTQVWRHLERHELTPAGDGLVLHGLYQGTGDNLGRPVPLTDQPATAPLAALIDAESAINTGPGLAVVYVPNQRPQRRWRRDPVGQYLGRSDLDGVEPLMDALDIGPGKGVAWDSDAEVYAPVRALASREGSGLPIEMHQFGIRFAEHQATAQQLVDDILRAAGYSASTFGEGTDGAAMTATEITARQQRSFLTRDRKIRLWRPALAELVEKLLVVDRLVFSSAVVPSRPDVAFADGVQDSPLSLAQTAQALKTAQAASTKTLVQLVHPDWDDTQVSDEVDLILSESGQSVPDPFASEGAGEAFTAVGSTGADQPATG
jgi:hypothetical protein